MGLCGAESEGEEQICYVPCLAKFLAGGCRVVSPESRSWDFCVQLIDCFEECSVREVRVARVVGVVVRSRVSGAWLTSWLCLLGSTEGAVFSVSVEQSASSMRNAGVTEAADWLSSQLKKELSNIDTDEAVTLARVFSHYLNLMGIAETHHRCACSLVGWDRTRPLWW